MNTARPEQVFFACCLSVVGLGLVVLGALRWFDRSISAAVTAGIR